MDVLLLGLMHSLASLQRMAESRKNFRVHASFKARVPGAVDPNLHPGCTNSRSRGAKLRVDLSSGAR